MSGWRAPWPTTPPEASLAFSTKSTRVPPTTKQIYYFKKSTVLFNPLSNASKKYQNIH